jgi:hypothetical protein
MKLTIELDRETDGRWIAEIPELNVPSFTASRDRTRLSGRKRPRGRLFATRLLTENFLPMLGKLCSISRHESVAFREGAARFSRAEAHRMAARPDGGITQDSEE